MIPEVDASSSLEDIKTATMAQPAGFSQSFAITLEGAASQVTSVTKAGKYTFYVNNVQIYSLTYDETNAVKNGDLVIVSGYPTHRTSGSGNPVFALTNCTLISRTAG